MTIALFIGRFQPFHNAHLQDICQIQKTNKEIIIGIGSSQEKNTKENPFSYDERKKMIRAALKSKKISNFKIFPIPDFYDDVKWVGYINKKIKNFDCVYSGNKWVLNCFKKHKKSTKSIILIDGISSTIIRNKIINNKKWEHLVPKEIALMIKKFDGIKRIKENSSP